MMIPYRIMVFGVMFPQKSNRLLIRQKDEIDRGEGIPHSQVMAEIKNRFLNK